MWPKYADANIARGHPLEANIRKLAEESSDEMNSTYVVPCE